uniref:Uncharacterized protein n=1 Tax=Ditylenchus dipsaci TaxID=166011 RepID=A0A915E8T7_9BILA
MATGLLGTPRSTWTGLGKKPYAVNTNGNSLDLHQHAGIQPSHLPAPNAHSTPPVGGGGPLPVHQPNGGHVIKRLDPVKLTVDEVPYADS